MTKSRYLRRREAITLDPLPAEDGRVLVKASSMRLSSQRLDWTTAAASIAARSRTQEEAMTGHRIRRSATSTASMAKALNRPNTVLGI
jgi:hypothetical protein